MDLILWRHAEAHLIREGQDDLERALTPKGERQAQRMADWLNQRLAESTRVLVIGHQPTLGIVAARLLAGVEQFWSVRKGAVWWLRGREREGSSQVVLQAMQGPDML